MNEWVHCTWFYRQRPEDDVQSTDSMYSKIYTEHLHVNINLILNFKR